MWNKTPTITSTMISVEALEKLEKPWNWYYHYTIGLNHTKMMLKKTVGTTYIRPNLY